MELLRLTDDKSALKQFIEFPYELYRDDARYISPLRHEQCFFLKPDSPLYQSGEITSAHFLAQENGTVIGRISAFTNSNLRDQDGPIGTVGLFECSDRYDVAEKLFTQAISWLAVERNVNTVWGPMNGDIWHGYRLMTRGFDQDPFVGEPYNKPYYAEFFTRFGFRVKQEWDSVEIDGADAIAKMLTRGKQRLDLLISQGYRFETWSVNDGDSQMRALHRVLCESYSGFLGFSSISLAEFTALFGKMQAAFDPDLHLLVYDPSGRCVGFGIAFPDLADSVRSMHGDDNLPARVRFLLNRRRARRLNFYIGGEVPDQEAKATGLGRAGFYFIVNRGLEKGYNNLLLTLRVKHNKAHGLAARSGVVPQREYALYEYRYGN